MTPSCHSLPLPPPFISFIAADKCLLHMHAHDCTYTPHFLGTVRAVPLVILGLWYLYPTNLNHNHTIY